MPEPAVGIGADGRRQRAGPHDAEAQHQHQLGQQDQPDRSAPSGAFFMKPALQLGEIDVEHHDHEQEQHGHRADVDDDQDHRQELGAQQHEQARRH